MKIIGLQAENIKRLTAVEINPTGNMVEITGKNGNGKTSVLDSIWWALTTAKNIQASPIRNGENEARIRLDLGDLIVTRKFKRKDDDEIATSLTVESAEGARFSSPVKVLEELVGALSMDPLEFMRSKPQDQLKTLRSFVPGVDFDAIEAANKADFDKRTDINREAKSFRTQAQAIDVPAGTASELVDEAELVAELEKAGEHNTDIEARKARRETAREQIANLRKAHDDLMAKVAELQEQARVAASEAQDAYNKACHLQNKLDEADPLPDPIDTAEVRRKIEDARKNNEAARLTLQRAELEKKAREKEAESKALTQQIDDRKLEMQKAVEAAGMPVPGLSFSDDGVLLDGLPLEQASDAQQLRASIAIAMAMNPKLRVIRVRDGSLLDEDAMKLLAEVADEHDFQVWIERVDSSGKVGFVIENGEVAARPEPALTAAE